MSFIKGKVKVGICGFRGRMDKLFGTYHAIEIQQTFYDPPPVETLEKWSKKAPPEFDFTMKAWQVITHEAKSPTYKRMFTDIPAGEHWQLGSFKPTKWVMHGLEKTLEAARILSAKVVVFQCPQSFIPGKEHIENLSNFMEKANELRRKLGINLRFGWEPRGKHWTDEVIHNICKNYDLVHVVDIFERKPVTNKFFYFRLHGGNKYSHIYRNDELEYLISEFQKYESGYCMFNNMKMLDDASRLIIAIIKYEMQKST